MFQVIFAQPSNIPLYCAQLLEDKLHQRSKTEEDSRMEEETRQKEEEEHRRHVEQVREEFRRKTKTLNQRKHCESQTGFTTDSGIYVVLTNTGCPKNYSLIKCF